MGLFDNMMGMLGGEGDGEGRGASNIVGSLLNQGGGGPSSSLVAALLGGRQGADGQGAGGEGMGGPGMAGQGMDGQEAGDGSMGGYGAAQPGAAGAGGLGGMLEQLATNGLGEHVSSWLSNNPNLPVSEQQIHDALGSDQVRELAQSSGLPVGDFLQQLAQHLPNAASEAAGSNPG